MKQTGKRTAALLVIASSEMQVRVPVLHKKDRNGSYSKAGRRPERAGVN